MLQTKIHLNLVYDTATSNVTPALDPAFRPQEVILLHGPAHKRRASCLESVLKPAGIKVSRWPVKDIMDLMHIRERVLELLATREDEDIALNASGGTRPMSMAAYGIFYAFNKPVFYIHPETDHVTWLHRNDLPVFNCANRIKLPDFLRAHGAEPGKNKRRGPIIPHLRELTTELALSAKYLAEPLTTLNWLAQRADNPRLVSPPLDARQRTWSELQFLLERFEQAGVLQYRDHCLHFPDENARFYANGGWLEEHVFATLFGLRKQLSQIQDIGRSLEICRDGTGKAVKNELDVAFLANNHLYLIECKTRRFQSGPHAHTPATEVLYKLDTLKGLLGGRYTHAMLVSYHPLSAWDRQRADDLGLHICAAGELRRLKQKLTQWLQAPVFQKT